jgi:hypothetical protein
VEQPNRGDPRSALRAEAAGIRPLMQQERSRRSRSAYRRFGLTGYSYLNDLSLSPANGQSIRLRGKRSAPMPLPLVIQLPTSRPQSRRCAEHWGNCENLVTVQCRSTRLLSGLDSRPASIVTEVIRIVMYLTTCSYLMFDSVVLLK